MGRRDKDEIPQTEINNPKDIIMHYVNRPLTIFLVILTLIGCQSQTQKTTGNTHPVTDEQAADDSVTDTTGTPTATADLQETYWKLTELMGKPALKRLTANAKHTLNSGNKTTKWKDLQDAIP